MLFAQEGRLLALLTPAFSRMWRGVALLNAGETAQGHDVLAEALEHVRFDDGRIRDIIERHLYAGSGRANLSAETLADLAAIRHYRRERSAQVVPLLDRRPVLVTLGFIAVSVLVWGLTERFGSSEDARTLVRFGANVPALVMQGEWFRLVSSIFLHVGFLHLFFNAYACYLFGNFVERATERWQLFVLFMASGIAGSATSFLFGAHLISAGASGAVFGLLGAGTVIALRFRETLPRNMRKMYGFNFLFIAVINMIFGLLETRIDNLAHGGGFAAGLMIGVFMVPATGSMMRRRAFRVAGILLALGLALATWATVTNVRGGGYPLRAVPFNTYVHAKGEWKASVPVFWEQVREESSTAIFVDPLSEHSGPALTISSIRGSRLVLVTDKNEKVVRAEPRDFGGRQYLETMITAIRGEESVVRFLFQCSGRKRIYVLRFECDAGDMPAYRSGIIERVMQSFEFVDEAE